MKLIQTKDYLLLIDEEAEIKENDLFLGDDRDRFTESERWKICKNESTEGVNYLMCEGVGYQKGYNAFLIIAYYPLTKEAKELDLPLLPNPFKAAQSKQFSLENIEKEADKFARERFQNSDKFDFISNKNNLISFVKRFIQSLSTQKLPKEFIPEISSESLDNGYEIIIKEGKKELVGEYKYD